MFKYNENGFKIIENNKVLACEDCCDSDKLPSDVEIEWCKCDRCQEEDDIFTRDFWQEKVDWMNAGDITEHNQKTARINGHHYCIGNSQPGDTILGNGGRKFTIRFISGPHKGQDIVTYDLWEQGKIESPYDSVLLNNAVFVSFN